MTRNADDSAATYDQRQYRMMLSRINTYDGGQIHIGQLISDLESLMGSLESVDLGWKQLFLKEWAKIEDCYAYSLDQGEQEINPVGRDIIKGALLTMKTLVSSRIVAERNALMEEGTMIFKMSWRATEEGWVLDGRVLTDTKRILARATFHLPYDQEYDLKELLGIDAQKHAEKVLGDLLKDMVERLPS